MQNYLNKNPIILNIKKIKNQEFITEKIITTRKKGGNGDINFDDINFDDLDFDNLDISDLDISHIDLSDDYISSSKTKYDNMIEDNKKTDKNIKKSIDSEIKFFIDDNIEQLKEKIYLLTDILPFKQFIIFNNKQLGYHFSLYNNQLDISINNILKNKDDIVSYNNLIIPLDNYLYNNKDAISISSNERSTLLLHLVKEAIESEIDLEFDIYSLDLFINKTNKKEIIYHFNSDNDIEHMIYYSFILKYYPYFSYELFDTFIHNEEDIQFIYNDIILNKKILENKYKKQQNILNKIYAIEDSKTLKKKYKDTMNQITNFNILNCKAEIKNNFDVSLNVFNMKELFNLIEINKIENLTYIQLNLLIDNKIKEIIKINKFIKTNIKKYFFNVDSLLLKFNLEYKKYQIELFHGVEFILIINRNGNYIIEISFPEILHIDYNKLVNILLDSINPIIIQLNTLLNSQQKLQPITQYNIFLTDINYNISWNKILTPDLYIKFQHMLEYYVEAGILSKVHSIGTDLNYTINKFSFDFKKNQYTQSDNEFSYFTDKMYKNKWDIYNKKINIVTKVTSVTFDFNNITFNEYEKLTNYIYFLIYSNLDKLKINKSDTSKSISNKKSLSQLKDIDPVLFSYENKKNNKDNSYSRVCQKPNQPIIISKNDLSKYKNAIKYKNMTTGEPIYYTCPSKDVPYLKFLQNHHPNNYCIPCCKKKDSLQIEGSKYKSVHTQCLKHYSYNEKQDVKIDTNNYTMNFTNIVPDNRFMELPINLSKMFNNDKSKYYIYGINNSILHTMSDIYKEDINIIVKMVIEYLTDNEFIFDKLLDSQLGNYFTNTKHLINAIQNKFLLNKILVSDFKEWDVLFIDIFRQYDIQITIFENEMYKPYKSLKFIKNQSFNENITYIYLYKQENYYNPIYFINSDEKIVQKSFNSSDTINKIMLKIINLNINSIKLDLYKLTELIDKKYKITEYYINKKNQCYAVIIKKNNDNIYFGILPTYLPKFVNSQKKNIIVKNIKYNYFSFDIKNYKINYKSLFEFLKKINVKIENILSFDKKIIGITYKNNDTEINNYFSEITENTFYNNNKNLKNNKIIKLLYNPVQINNALQKKISVDNKNQTLYTKSIYKRYLYNLLLMELFQYLKKNKDLTLRKKILHVLTMIDIKHLSDNYHNDLYSTINRYISNKYKLPKNNIDDIYSEVLHTILPIAKNKSIKVDEKHKKIKDLFDIKDFIFDNIEMILFKNKSVKEIYNHLQEIFKDLVKIKNLKSVEITEISSCENNESGYCFNGKLIVESQEKLNKMLNLIAHDIYNPLKRDIILNPLYFDVNNNKLKFTDYVNEIIYIR